MQQNVSQFGAHSYYGKETWQPCEQLLRSVSSLDRFAGLAPLWRKGDKAVRYAGVFDLDLDCTPGIPLFVDKPELVPSDTKAVKEAFYARFREEQGDLQRVADVCPRFARVYRDYQAIATALEQSGHRFLGYFSGGKGFHVYVFEESLFFSVPAKRGACGLELMAKNWLSALCCEVQLDLSVYSGILKTDVRAHPDSHFWPSLIDQGRALALQDNDQLSAQLLEFWRWAAATAERLWDSALSVPLQKATEATQNTRPTVKAAPLQGSPYDQAELSWVQAQFGPVLRVCRLNTPFCTISYELVSTYCVQRGSKHASNHARVLLRRSSGIAWQSCFDPVCLADKSWKPTHVRVPRLNKL